MPSGYLTLINHHTQGPRCDVTPIFGDYAAFAALLDEFTAQLGGVECDVVAGIDALGFILGTALALRLRKGFIPVRKGGKLPVPANAMAFVDYSGQRKSLELSAAALRPGMRVLVADEWIETGAQVGAAIHLLEAQGAIIAGIVSICMNCNEKTDRLRTRYACFTAMEADAESGK